MATSKRLRACDACHSIKIKCLLGSEERDPPCPRCVRLGKECIITPPKRQKDRVAELEAQVEALSRQLALQKIRTEVDIPVEQPGKISESKKKRRLDRSVSETEFTDCTFDIDHIVAPSTQKDVFHKYVTEMIPKFSLVPLARIDQDYSTLRRRRSLLLHPIIYASSHGKVTPDARDQIGKAVTNSLDPATSASVEKSIELVQAILITAQWYQSPRHRTDTTPTTLIRLAIDVAQDLGLRGSDGSSAFLASPTSQLNSVEAAGTWLVCYMLSTCIANLFDTPNFVQWGPREDITLVMLEYINEQDDDRLLAQYIRAERLCEQLIALSRKEERGNFTANKKQQNLVTDWKAQIPSNLTCPTLPFWEHVVMMYLHEGILHSATNKQSFSGPFVAERLSVSDIPAPIVTPEHLDSILTLRDNIHGLLDVYCSFDTATIMALPPILFASRVCYSQWILVRIYLALTALGNTFGDFLDPSCLKVDEYLDKVIQLALQIRQIDATCATARLLSASLRLKEWLDSYRATQLAQSTIATTTPSETFSDPSMVFPDFAINWGDLNMAGDAFDAELNGSLTDPLVLQPLEHSEQKDL